MIIIIEGVDKTGKTTLAKELAKKLGLQYFKSNLQKGHFNNNDFKNALKYEGLFMIDFLEQVNINLIIDRSYPSEFAYARAYERETDDKILFELDDRCAKLGVLMIYCYKTDNDQYLNELTDEIIIDHTKMDLIKHCYDSFFKMTACKHLYLNMDSRDLDKQIYAVKEWLKGVEI